MLIIIILSLILDIIINYYLPFLPSFFSYLQPLLFISTIIFFIMIEYRNKKKLRFLFIMVVIYDLLFNKIYFLYPIIFILLYRIIAYLKKRLNNSFFSFIMIFILSLIIFISIKYMVLMILGITNKSLLFMYNQIIKILLLNIVYSIILYYFLGIKNKKT